MSNLIRKPAELAVKETIAALIYGQPGMGKTTLACSAPSPVLFDFDGGVVRLREEHQVDTLQVDNWSMAMAALDELSRDREGYRTIIVDTLSKMIDCIITDVCSVGQPSPKQWGLVNAKFKTFLRGVQSLGMHVIFVAQRESEKNGDDIRQVPSVRASNYKDIVCDMDVIGYMEMVNVRGENTRRITFDPSTRNEGKNTADFAPYYDLPTLQPGERSTFMADRFAEYIERQRQRMEQRKDTAAKVTEMMAEAEKRVAAVEDAMSMNEVVAWFKEQPVVGDFKARGRELIKSKAKTMGFTLNRESKLYE